MWLWVLIVLLLIGAVGVVATGRWGQMTSAETDRADAVIPSGRRLTAEDIRDVRLTTGLRGYRMDEVDALLDRLQSELPRRAEVSGDESSTSESAPSEPPRDDSGSTTVEHTADGVDARVVDDD